MSTPRQHNSDSEADGPIVPEPSHAERARTLVHVQRTGSLSTLSRKQPGWPFGSVMPYAVDNQGQPVFLISTMAMHTQNLVSDPRASLLITPADTSGDPVGAARVTLMGSVTKVPREEAAHVRGLYLTRHPNASYWVDFNDFGFFRMAVAEIYFVGGFGTMGWVTADDYLVAAVDPLADHVSDLIREINAEEAETLLLLARVFGTVDAQQATMTAVDRLGFHLRIRTPDRMQGGRIAFARPVANSRDVRTGLSGLAEQARAGLQALHSL